MGLDIFRLNTCHVAQDPARLPSADGEGENISRSGPRLPGVRALYDDSLDYALVLGEYCEEIFEPAIEKLRIQGIEEGPTEVGTGVDSQNQFFSSKITVRLISQLPFPTFNSGKGMHETPIF